MMIVNRPNTLTGKDKGTGQSIMNSDLPKSVPSHCLTPLGDKMLTDIYNTSYYYVAEMISSMEMYSGIGQLAQAMSAVFVDLDEFLRKDLIARKYAVVSLQEPIKR